MHPFRFGVNRTGAASLKEWQEYARTAEDLGYTNLIMQDHVDQQFAPFPALVAAAGVTSRIHLTTIVLDNDFRHPAVVAKEAATVDLLTEGRLELGLGAGWLQADYDKLGLSFDAAGERMSRFMDAVSVVKAFFQDEPTFSVDSLHYRIRNLEAWPRPVQKPHPPLLIGGRQKRMLSFAAREADVVSVSMLDPRTPGGPQPPSFAEKIEWVRRAAGDRFDAIEVHANSPGLRVTDDQRGAIEAAAERLKVAPEHVLDSPANLIGSVDAVVEQMQRWRESCSLNYFVVPYARMLELAPVIARLSRS
ncbi:MAG TPA: TIGR03621 family F420-dependent LLM class oxidoreductase [Dehalococcoidia bacterium]|nr:TIGR03621 family F420-dependent LLM class oxidoreductase [Dehalococcoidia bacterium]